MTALSAMIFDLGQVVIGWDPRRAFPPELSPSAVDNFLERSAFHERNASHDAGRPFAESVAELAGSQAPHDANTLQYYVDNFDKSLTGPVPGTAELLADLKAEGIRLYALTNWSHETFHHAREAAPALGYFEDILVSGVEQLIKPDEKIFRLALQRWDLDPACTGFLDDNADNVDAARTVGLRAHRFTTAEDARTWIRREREAA